jgi:hypothetical protein
MSDHPDSETATPSETSAQRWAAQAHAIIEAEGPSGLAGLLADGFVQETHRGGPQAIRRDGLLGSVRSMRDMGLHVSGFTVATAGDLSVLTQRSYRHGPTTVELLAISVWTVDGLLQRLIEYDVSSLEEALATLADVTGEPVVRLDPPAERPGQL